MMKTENITEPHIESYNSLFKNNIFRNVIKNTSSLVIDHLRLEVVDYNVHQPYITDKNNISIDRRLLPRECRLTNTSYRGKLYLKFNLYHDDELLLSELRQCGNFPIMVKSGFCHLSEETNMSLVDEDDNEIGGYFIINGIDKLVRFHILQKRNYSFAILRPSKNKMYIDKLISIRSVSNDEIGKMNYIHYSVDGDVFLRFFRRKNEFHIPIVVILKALVNTSDAEIYSMLDNDSYIHTPLKKANTFGVFSQKECVEYIGARFKTYIDAKTNEDAGNEIISTMICPHLTDYEDKFNFLILSIKKLFALVKNEIIPEDPDSPSSHELLTETQLFANILKDKLEDCKRSFRMHHRKLLTRGNQVKKKNKNEDHPSTDLQPVSNREIFLQAFKTYDFGLIGKAFESFLSTGNINCSTSSDILQTAGFAIIAERINFYRYISHFRSVNRGSFFTEVRTTGVRKLRPESWGFFCPVHTPDGTPCGLLTHLTISTRVTNILDDFDVNVLYSMGVIPVFRGALFATPVFYNGRFVGYASNPTEVVENIREYRRNRNMKFEIIYSNGDKLFNCVNIYNTISRLTRQVKNIKSGLNDSIGIMEQVFLNIRLRNNENFLIDKETNLNELSSFDYEELDNQNILSIVASLTPFSEYNQSPRNMYQCQMAKQSMGFPAYNLRTRNDTKMYVLNYNQHPIVRNKNYEILKDYPLGLNCIVAVLAYTAYDMEDAMVINKGSMERGLFCGFVYKVEKIQLPKECFFSYFPDVGYKLRSGDLLYKYMDLGGKEVPVKASGMEGYVIDTIDIFENETLCANIKFRIIRNPNIGDKFCSRHGQKGVCSMHWPSIDMPFTEQGIVPDIIINPHAFPSRMTIGMLIESMAGKSGTCLGKFQDATAFEKNCFLGDELNFDESKVSIGEELKKSGFNYFGNEPMYSGVSGNEFRTDIYIGVVFYQRLRHMVNDKYQVRTSGAVVATTRQPVGGRKNLGGVRFGEMERDALIAHGTPYLLNDRLLKCSDHSVFTYCSKCKSILFTFNSNCICGGKEFNTIELPYVFKYLCTELLSMNIRVVLEVK